MLEVYSFWTNLADKETDKQADGQTGKHNRPLRRGSNSLISIASWLNPHICSEPVTKQKDAGAGQNKRLPAHANATDTQFNRSL